MYYYSITLRILRRLLLGAQKMHSEAKLLPVVVAYKTTVARTIIKVRSALGVAQFDSFTSYRFVPQ